MPPRKRSSDGPRQRAPANTVLSQTKARIALLPEEKRASVEAALALVLAKEVQARPAAALAKQLLATLAALEADSAAPERGDGVDDLAAGVAGKLRAV